MISGKIKPGPKNKRAINWTEEYYSLLTLEALSLLLGIM